jgi:hypothetical protein
LRPEDVAVATDDGLIHDLGRDDPTGLALALRERRLVKRALDIPAAELPGDPADWPAADPDLTERVEDQLARDVGIAPGNLFLDFPAKADMMGVGLPLVRRTGEAVHLAGADAEAHLGLPRVAAELYRSARRLRVFTTRPAPIARDAVVALVMLSKEEITARLVADRGLLTPAAARSASTASSPRPRHPGTPRHRPGR